MDDLNKKPDADPGKQPPESQNPAPEKGKGPDDKQPTAGEKEVQARIDALKQEEQRLMQKVTEARKAARGEGDDLLGDINPVDAPAPEKKPDAGGDDPDKKGKLDPQTDTEYLVRKSNLKDALGDFLEKHPELKPENDVGNLKYAKLKEFFKISKGDISVRDFTKKLEGAYTAAFPDEVISRAKEEGKNEALKQNLKDSQIGETYSVRTPSGETITLSRAEREAAQHHPGGVQGYIKSKQEIAKGKEESNKGYLDLTQRKK